MKFAHACILLACVALVLAPLFAAPVPQDTDDAFRAQFQKALDAGAKPEQLKLVRSDARNAEIWIVRLAENLSEKPDPAEKALFDALAESWKGVWKGEFPDRAAAYFAGLDAAKRKIRVDLLQRWKVAWRDFDNNLEKKDGMVFANVVDEIDALAGAFESEGDLFRASEAYRAFSMCYDEPWRGTAADLHRAWTGLGHAIELREKLDLKDPILEELTKRRAALTARGADKKGGATPGPIDPGAGGRGGAAAPAAGTAMTAPLAFEVLSGYDAFTRPIFGCDEIYEVWNAVQLQGKGTITTFNTTSECPPIVRTGSSDIRFDTNGDKQGDEKISMTGNIVPVKVQIGGEKKRPWAFFAVIGASKDTYQGIEVNLAPDDNQYTIYTLGAASVTGLLGTTSVRIIDDSLDGVYGNKPQAYGTAGMTSDSYEPMLDSIVVGGGKRARPWSEIQEIDGSFYRLEVQEQGAKLVAMPAGVDTGILKLEFKGPVAPTYVVVQGSSDTKDCFYDLVEGGSKGVRVPVGNYSLYYGELRKGKKKQMQKTLIVAPRVGAPSWSVRKGETTAVTLGAPFGFDFRHEVDSGKLTVKGRTVVVTGTAGERYERAWNCVPRPEVAWRKKGQKNPGGNAKMGIGDLDTINNRDLGWTAVWFPLDVVIDTKEKSNAFEVQLVQKKHDLFGKVESAWKE